MNKILVPCDFSETSENALVYATELAKYLSASLVLLHIDQIPVMSSEFGMTPYTVADTAGDSREMLQKIADKIRTREPSISGVEFFSEIGNATESIHEFTKTHSVDLIVMGISGHGSKFMKNLFGSTAVAVSKRVEIPAIIVPPGVKYKKIQNIAYACDYNPEIEQSTTLTQVKYINTLLDADLQILHVIPEGHNLDAKESEVDCFVEQKLENATHKTYIIAENNVSEGLLFFISHHEIDMIIIEPKRHTFMHNLFYQSITNEMAFFSPVPVLTIHG
jgi:nucleotide-binding universal stress UspA family protein